MLLLQGTNSHVLMQPAGLSQRGPAPGVRWADTGSIWPAGPWDAPADPRYTAPSGAGIAGAKGGEGAAVRQAQTLQRCSRFWAAAPASLLAQGLHDVPAAGSGTITFATELRQPGLAYLAQHKVHGRAMLPSAVLLETVGVFDWLLA